MSYLLDYSGGKIKSDNIKSRQRCGSKGILYTVDERRNWYDRFEKHFIHSSNIYQVFIICQV